mgnify:CR=1 FL=1
MNSSKPYLIRALYEWIVDNDCTPYVLVAIDMPGVQVPDGYGENGQLVLNLAPHAIQNLLMNNEVICFEARFSGVPHRLVLPIYAVMAIYAQENGQGMFFELEEADALAELSIEADPTPMDSATETHKDKPDSKPGLRLIK